MGGDQGGDKRGPNLCFRCGKLVALVLFVVYLAVTARASALARAVGSAHGNKEGRRTVKEIADKILRLSAELEEANRKAWN